MFTATDFRLETLALVSDFNIYSALDRYDSVKDLEELVFNFFDIRVADRNYSLD